MPLGFSQDKSHWEYEIFEKGKSRVHGEEAIYTSKLVFRVGIIQNVIFEQKHGGFGGEPNRYFQKKCSQQSIYKDTTPRQRCIWHVEGKGIEQWEGRGKPGSWTTVPDHGNHDKDASFKYDNHTLDRLAFAFKLYSLIFSLIMWSTD